MAAMTPPPNIRRLPHQTIFSTMGNNKFSVWAPDLGIPSGNCLAERDPDRRSLPGKSASTRSPTWPENSGCPDPRPAEKGAGYTRLQ